jgi:hypothetical protein
VEIARLDGNPEKAPRAEQMRLAHVLVEGPGTHPLGERRGLAPTLARRLLEQLHAVRPLVARPSCAGARVARPRAPGSACDARV